MRQLQDRPAGHPARRLADHLTPFIHNEWYVAARSVEIDRSLRSRTILGVGILLYRTMGGSVVALRDRCPHRSFPLSKGTLEADTVVCGYHGLAFGPEGRCVHLPLQAVIPSGVRTRKFPIVERAPLVWIWMGDPDLADASIIPDHHWLSAPDYASFSGYLHVRSNYVRLHENVLDLTHFPFLHGERVGDLTYAQTPFDVSQEGQSVRITRKLCDHPVNGAYGSRIGNLGHRVDRTSESWFKTPGFHVAHATIDDLEGGVNGRSSFHFKIFHMFTPETPTSTHYFYASARDVAIDDPKVSEEAQASAIATFLEDVEALEWIEDVWAREEDDFQEISIGGDRAGVFMRRIIARRAAQEA